MDTIAKACVQCGGAIQEGRLPTMPPTEAKYCTDCRADRRRQATRKYVWRPEYEAYLKAHYYGGLNRRFLVLNRMIRETGLPRWYIKKRAAALGLTLHPDSRKWTREEEQILENLLGKVSALTIARRLKRTEASVALKIKRLGWSRAVREGYTMRALERAWAKTTTRSSGGSSVDGCAIGSRRLGGITEPEKISIDFGRRAFCCSSESTLKRSTLGKPTLVGF
jgi:hypothetical protein